ncbi:hypothetical protein [Erythrobacter sp. CCH5-A1]|jgi:hypothetical protein|uniref:hypothetical protein n=1 Tax=Erythrobacter sp. CCH5-A1 TaxID=1768792 RepID=UPI00083675EB|nr:hypothetical protein [Erythrobacter sp. CCH5-A1]
MLTVLDWLKTPMAAPETRTLKVMRMAILVLSMMVVVSVAAIDPLRAAIGIGAGAVVAGLLLILAALVPVYLLIKTRADDAHLSALLAETDQ